MSILRFAITGLPALQQGVALAPQTLGEFGDTPYTGSADEGLPAGLSYDPATSILSGTPTVSGMFYFNVTISDGTTTVVQNFSGVIADASLLIVENGTVVAGANAYLSLDEANTIIATDMQTDPTKWNALTNADKERWLLWATRWLDDRAIWSGKRFTDPFYPKQTPDGPLQSLGWPRKNAFDREGHAISQTVVPVEVRRATALLANHYLNTDDDELQAGIRRFRADTFEIEYQQGYFQSPVPPWIKFVLNGLGQLGNEIGFKKIKRV